MPSLGLEHVAVAGDEERALAVGHGEHRLEAAQHAVGAPVLGQLDGRAHEVALVLLELRLEALEQREGIGGGAGEPGEHLVVVQPAHLARGRLHHGLAEGDLAVAAHDDTAGAAHGNDGGQGKSPRCGAMNARMQGDMGHRRRLFNAARPSVSAALASVQNETELAPGFVDRHGDRVGEVQAAAVRAHRQAQAALRSAVLLRLAILLCRSHAAELPQPKIRAREAKIGIALPRAWLDAHALARADLATERDDLAEMGLALSVEAAG